jgi:hypothetical protein
VPDGELGQGLAVETPGTEDLGPIEHVGQRGGGPGQPRQSLILCRKWVNRRKSRVYGMLTVGQCQRYIPFVVAAEGLEV